LAVARSLAASTPPSPQLGIIRTGKVHYLLEDATSDLTTHSLLGPRYVTQEEIDTGKAKINNARGELSQARQATEAAKAQ
jgi:hypothetical protein